MARWCMFAALAVVFFLLSCSVLVPPAEAETRAPSIDGTAHRHLAAAELRPGALNGTERFSTGATEERPEEESARTERKRLARRRPSSSPGWFGKRMGTRSRLLLAVSVIAGVMFMLRQFGGPVLKCLTGLVGGSKPDDGLTLTPLPYDSRENDTCEALLTEIARESEGAAVAASGTRAGSTLGVPRSPYDVVGSVLVPFAVVIIAVGLLIMLGPGDTVGPERAFSEDEVALRAGEDEADYFFVPFEVTDDGKIVGGEWRDKDGNLVEGGFLQFFPFFGQDGYGTPQSGDVEGLSPDEDLLERVRTALFKALTKNKETEARVIGGRGGNESIKGYDGDPSDITPSVPYEFYKPGRQSGSDTKILFKGDPSTNVTPEARQTDDRYLEPGSADEE